MMKTRVLLPLLAVMLSGCFTLPIWYVHDEDGLVQVNRPAYAFDMRRAVLEGAASTGFRLVDEAPGCLVCQFENPAVGMLKVAVFYGTVEFQVTYLDSRNLAYDPGTGRIDGAYINLIRALKNNIQYRARIQKPVVSI